jgi:hypothetical protein
VLRSDKVHGVRYCSGSTVEAAFGCAVAWADYFAAIEVA